LTENQIGITTESGNDMALWSTWNMVANFEPTAFFRIRDKLRIVVVEECIFGEWVGWDKVEER
jgi:hypothetical protein